MPNYNPSATETMGIEAFPTGAVSQTILSSGTVAGMNLKSLAAETINQVWLYGKGNVAGYFTLDIYPRTWLLLDAPVPPIFSTNYNLNEDVTITNITGTPTNTAGNRYTNIDEGTASYNRADYLFPTAQAVATQYEGRINSSTFSGVRPLSLQINAVVEMAGAGAKLGLSRHDLTLNIGGNLYNQNFANAHNITQPYDSGFWTFWARFDANPATGAPWTAADIASFDSTNEVGWHPVAGSITDGIHPNPNEHLVALDVTVTYTYERRVATGTLNNGVDNIPTWKAWTIQDVATGGNWSKTSGLDYVYVLRKSPNATSSPSASFTWYGVGLADLAPLLSNFNAYGITLVNGVPTESVDQDRWYGIIVNTTAPANSADSQVYATMVEEPVNSGVTGTTEFTATAAKTYGVVTVMVKPTDDVNASLVLQLKRRSDNANMGSSITILKSDADVLPDLGNGWKKWRGQMATPTTLAAGSQYYWSFSSGATIGSWLVANLYTGGSGNPLTFGGTTDRAFHTVAGEDDAYDVQILTATVPTAPSTFTVFGQGYWIEGSDGSDGVVRAGYAGLTQVLYNDILWTATGLGSLFSHYEIQRYEEEHNLLFNSNFEATPFDANWSLDATYATWVSYGAKVIDINCIQCTVNTPSMGSNPDHYGRAQQTVRAVHMYGRDEGFVLSAWMNAPAGRQIGLSAYRGYDVGGVAKYPWDVAFPADGSPGYGQLYTATGGWQRVVLVIPADTSTSTTMEMNIRAGIGYDTWTAGQQFYVDGVQLEVGNTMSAYRPRSDDLTATVTSPITAWKTIFLGTGEGGNQFWDFEAKHNTSCKYRMRVFRNDGAFSAWTPTAAMTTSPLLTDVWSFVSNEKPSLNCIFYKEAGIDYEFPNADEVEFHPVFGKDFYVVLQPTENRGVRFDLTVALSSLNSMNHGSSPLGWALYNNLRALAEDPDLSYVCVHDPYNNRLLAKLTVPTGPYPTPNAFWYATIHVTQITEEFSTPTQFAR